MSTIFEARRVLLFVGLVAVTPAAGFSQTMAARSAAPTPGTDGGPGGAVAIPRNPYAGEWEGTMAERGAAADAATTPMTMSFAVADAAAQTYSGQTIVAGSAPSAHLNFDAVPVAVTATAVASGGATMARRTASGDGSAAVAAAAVAGGSGTAMRRTADGGPSAAASGPSDRGGLSQLDLSDNTALFVSSAQRTPLLCDTGHRCASMPVLHWEEQNASGETLVYTAQLVAPDKITGVVRRHTESGDESVATFNLLRRP